MFFGNGREGGRVNQLQLKDIVHERDEAGNLLPIEVELESYRIFDTVEKDGKKEKVLKEKGPSILVLPLSRGEIKTLAMNLVKKKKEGKDVFETTEDQDGELIKNYLVEPKIPEEKIRDLKPEYAAAIATAIMAVSLNQSQETMQQAGKAAVRKFAEELEDGVKKN